MKVLYLINSLGAGGAEQSLAEMLPLLPRHGIEPVVAALYRRAEGVEAQVLAAGVPVYFAQRQGWSGWWRDVRDLLDRQRPDVLHTTIFEADLVGRVAARGRPMRVVGSLVNTSYGPERREDPAVPAVKLEAARLLDSWTARHLAHRFHALTRSVEEHAVARLRIPRDRIVVVPRGRDPARLGAATPERRRAVRERLGLSDDDEIVLNVGRQEYQKDHESLLAAFAMVSAQRPRAVLVQAGRDGGTSALLRAQVGRDGIGDRVMFLGHRTDVPDLMAAADVFAFPSRFEGMGGAVIEAMALGLPAVVSDLPVLREVVEPDASALLAPVACPGRLAVAICRLLADDGLRRALGARGKQIFEQRYELSATTGQLTQALYAPLR